MANQQVTVVVRLKAKAGKEAQVRQELFNFLTLTPTRAEQGCLNFDMHEAPNDPSLFLFHENWTPRTTSNGISKLRISSAGSNSPKRCSPSRLS
jgi:hypothetical protein